MTDRFEEIKAHLARHQTSDYADAHYLLAEVERLRKIEDAARVWGKAEVHEMEDACDALADTLDQNRRPGTEMRTER